VKHLSRIAFLLILALCASACGDLSARQLETSREKNAAREAVKELNKLAAAVEAGADLKQYGALVMGAKPRVDGFYTKLSEGELSQEIRSAMKAYIDAGIAWEAMTYRQFQEWDLLVLKYPIPSDTGASLNQAEVLKTIWGKARQHLDRASALASQ
jgi:hypothetical protein